MRLILVSLGLLRVIAPDPSLFLACARYYLVRLTILPASMEDLVKAIPHFSGTANEDVIGWLDAINKIFDRVQLQPCNRYIAAQFYLKHTAALWFTHSRATIPDWSTFQSEIVNVFQPTRPCRASLPSLTTSQASLPETPEDARSCEPNAVSVAAADLDSDLELDTPPLTPVDSDPTPQPYRTSDENLDDHSVHPDHVLSVNSAARSAADLDVALTPTRPLKPVVDHAAQSTRGQPISHQFPLSAAFRSECCDIIRDASSSDRVPFHSVHHQWRYKRRRTLGSCRVFKPAKHQRWTLFRKWKYRH